MSIKESPRNDAPAPLLRSRPAGASPLAWVRGRPVATVFLLALGVRAVVATVLAIRYGNAVFSDDQTYSLMADQAAHGASAGWDEYTQWLYRHTWAFIPPLAGVYWLTGSSPIAGALFVAVFGAATAALTTLITLRVAGRRSAVAAGACVALFPSQVLWSSITMKDALVWAVLAGIALLVASALDATRTRQIAVLWLAVAACLILMSGLREHTTVVAALAILVTVVACLRRDAWQTACCGALVATCVPLLLGLGPLGLTFAINGGGDLEGRRALNAANANTALVPTLPSRRTAVDRRPAEEAEAAASRAAVAAQEAELEVARLRQAGDAVALSRAEVRAVEARRAAAAARERLQRLTSTAGRSPTSADAEFLDSGAGTGGNLRYLPHGLAAVVLQPFPWAFGDNSRVRLAKLENIVWYPMLLLSLLAIPSILRQRRVLFFPVCVGAAIALMYALSEGNFGTAYRHRGEFVWVVAVLAGVGLARIAAWRADAAVHHSTESDGLAAEKGGGQGWPGSLTSHRVPVSHEARTNSKMPQP